MLFLFYIQGEMMNRRKPTKAELQQAQPEAKCRLASPMNGNRKCGKSKPQKTQPILIDNKNTLNMKTEGEGTSPPHSPLEGKQHIKDKKTRGKKGNKSNKDLPAKQVSVFKIKEYKLARKLKHKAICRVHGMGFNSWGQYCKHLIEMHGHQEKYPCKVCKTVCTLLQAFTVHCTKHEEDNKRYQCKICLEKFMFPSNLKNHTHKHGGQKRVCPCKDGPGGVPCGRSFKEMYKCHWLTHNLSEIKRMFEGCPRKFTSIHYLKDHYSLMHGAPLQCENVLSGCDFHTCSWSTLVTHERYFCEFR